MSEKTMFPIFQQVKYFTPNENWGDVTKVAGFLILTLDKIRELYGKPFVIHCAYATDGHVKHSYHYKGLAVDFHIIDENTSFPQQVEKLEKVLRDLNLDNFCGLGIYPDWSHPGFHFDLRGFKARWGRIKETYYGFDYVLDYAKKKFEK